MSVRATTTPAEQTLDFSWVEWLALLMVVLTSFASQMAMPLWVGAVIESLRLTDAAVGRVGAWEFGAVALVSMFVGLRVQHFPIRATVGAGLLVLVLGNAVSVYAHDELTLTAARTIAGIGKGLMVAIAFSLVAGSSRPTRAFAILNGAYSAYSSVFYLTMPYAIEWDGASGAFLSMTAVALLGALFMPWFPTRRLPEAQIDASSLPSIPIFGWLAAAALFIMWVGHNAVWTFIERIGVHNGFSAYEIGSVLSVSAFLTIGGPALAHVIDTRFGFGKPMLISILLKSAVVFLMVMLADFAVYAVTVPAFLLLTMFITPYVMGMLSIADRAGRLAAISSGVIAGGSAAGSFFGGVATSAFGYVGLAWVAAAFFAAFVLVVLLSAPAAARFEQASETRHG